MARRRRKSSRRGRVSAALKRVHACQRKLGGKGLTRKQFSKAVSRCAKK